MTLPWQAKVVVWATSAAGLVVLALALASLARQEAQRDNRSRLTRERRNARLEKVGTPAGQPIDRLPLAAILEDPGSPGAPGAPGEH